MDGCGGQLQPCHKVKVDIPLLAFSKYKTKFTAYSTWVPKGGVADGYVLDVNCTLDSNHTALLMSGTFLNVKPSDIFYSICAD